MTLLLAVCACALACVIIAAFAYDIARKRLAQAYKSKLEIDTLGEDVHKRLDALERNDVKHELAIKNLVTETREELKKVTTKQSATIAAMNPGVRKQRMFG